jgi:hypothetical protein
VHPKFGQAMPVRDDEKEIKKGAIVRLWEQAIENGYSTLNRMSHYILNCVTKYRSIPVRDSQNPGQLISSFRRDSMKIF